MSRRGQKNYIRRPDVVERIGSYLGTSFPLFHGQSSKIVNINKYEDEAHLCDHPRQEAAPAGHREVGADGEMTTSEPRQLAVLVRADIRVRAQLLVALLLHTEVRREVRMLEVRMLEVTT